MDASAHAAGLLFALSALLSWASLSFFIRLAMKNAPLLRTTAATSTLNGAFAAALVFFALPASAFAPKLARTWALLPITGFFMIAISRLTYYYAIRRIGPSRTIPVAASTPAVTALLAAVFLDEPFTLPVTLGLLCLTAGITAVVRAAPAQPSAAADPARRDVVRGYVSAGLTTLNWSASGVMLKTIALDVHPLAASAMVIWIGCGFAWALAFAFGAGGERGGRVPRASWKWMLAAALCQTIAIPSYSSALARTWAVNVAAITSAQPLLVILGSHLFLRETENVTGRLALGAATAVAGTILILVG